MVGIPRTWIEESRFWICTNPGRCDSLQIPFLGSISGFPGCESRQFRIQTWDPTNFFFFSCRGGETNSLQTQNPMSGIRSALIRILELETLNDFSLRSGNT